MRRLTVSALLTLGLVARSAHATPSTTLVISEFRASGPTGGNDEFVEIFNLTNAPFDASGYQIAGSNSSGSTSVRVKFPAKTIIPPRGFLLVTNSTSYSGSVSGNVTYTVGITSDGGVALLDPASKIVDALGMNAGSSYKEGTVLPTFPASQDASYRRKSSNCSPDTDTDNNKNDFDLVNPSTPQNTTSCCADGQCTQVPAGQCYPATGTCNTMTGKCAYAVSPGKSCDDGNACTDSDVCLAGGACQGTNKVCSTPPAPLCVDAMTQRSFAAVGTCAGGSCSYSSVDASCSCNAATGLCQDPCGGVTCTTPPNTQCYAAAGTCNSLTGSCTYAPKAPGTACDDGAACSTGDACDASGTCSGAPKVCTPPAPECVAGASRSYAGGTCDAATGSCTFTQADAPCAFGCDGATGLCKGNPCAGVSCTSPPGACYQAVGVCDTGSGQCVYTPKISNTPCDDGAPCTDGDVCNGAGTCAGSTKVCTPPAPMCVAGASRSFSGGSCNAATGACSYTQTDAPCASGCDGATGLCKNDPCAGVVCNAPPSQCHQVTGTCAGGTCSYALKPENAQCDDGDLCTGPDRCTASGACVGATVVCNDPPKPICSSKKTSTSYIPVGTCGGGKCSYTSLANDCAFDCDTDTGLCVGDPCAGIACTTPPSGCHSDVGSCANGTCSYGLKQAGAACDDGDVCTTADACSAAGACKGSPKVCAAPPPPACVDAKTSRAAAASGLCKPDGSCDYPTTDTPCALGCIAATGLCSNDPCVGMKCDKPPSACHAPMGTCMAGACSYALLQPGAACNDDNPCTVNDACGANGTCAGVAKACNTPPDPECITPKSSQSASPAGTCSPIDGSCGYDSATTQCAVSCDMKTGLCIDDPCAGIVCNKPPNACHMAAGQCTKGACSYTPLAVGTACDDGDSCTKGDACDAKGACQGTATPGCGAGGSAGAAGKGGAGGSSGAAGTAGKGGSSGTAGKGGTGGTAGAQAGGAAGKGGSAQGGAGSGQGGAQGGAGGSADLPFVDNTGATAPGCGCAVPGQSDSPGPFSSLAALALGLASGLRRVRRGSPVTRGGGRSS